MTHVRVSPEDVEAVLRKHFSDSHNDLFKWRALDIWMSWGESQTLQDLKRVNVAPQNDIDAIKKNITYLKKRKIR